MPENIKLVRNPLTIIAIFAGTAELCGTSVLPFISEHNQDRYVIFLMSFPSALLILFFITLWLNHKVLYAPSDFENEENFFRALKPAEAKDVEEKEKKEIQEIQFEQKAQIKTDSSRARAAARTGATIKLKSLREAKTRHSLAENLALNKIGHLLGCPIRRQVTFAASGRKFVFDGIAKQDNKLIAIEVKYFSEPTVLLSRFRDTWLSILDAANRLPSDMKARFSLTFAMVSDKKLQNSDAFLGGLYSIIGNSPFPVDIQILSIEELEKEYFSKTASPN